MNDARLGEFLVKIGLITQTQLASAQERLDAINDTQAGKSKLASILVTMGYASAEELGRLAATALRLPYVALDKIRISSKLVGLLTREQARKAKGIVVKAEGKKFYLATFDPTNVIAFDELQFVLGGRVFPVVATEDEVVKAIGHYYSERIQYDRGYELPPSDTIDFDKAEMFDLRAARAKKEAASSHVDLSGGQEAANRKAAEQRLAAAAASTVQKKAAAAAPASQQPAQPPQRRPLAINDEAPVKAAAPVKPAAAAPAPAPAKPVAAPSVTAPAEELPVIRDAADLHSAPPEAPEELEVVELADDHADAEVEILDGEAEGEVVGDFEEAPVALEEEAPAPPPASADDLLSLFGAMAFGIEPGTSSGVQASAEGDELAKLFMGALGGPDPAAPAAPPDQPADMHQANDLAKELAHLLLDQTEFTA